MPILLAAAVLLQYQFPAEPFVVRLVTTMEGFLPILGGNQGKFEADLRLVVAKRGVNELTHEIKSSELKFDGEKLPLDLEMVRDFFPKTTLEVTAAGEVVKTDAPDKAPLIRIPGLDAKRLADLTFLPIRFPADPVEVESKWSFKKKFGDADMIFDCLILGLDEQTVKISFDLKQTFKGLENAALETVTKREDAVSEVTTDLVGKGTAEFSRAIGLFKKSETSTTATRRSKDLTTGKETETKLQTTHVVTLEGKQ